MGWLRLRQICLVSEDLESAAEDLEAILSIRICHRDPRVGVFGLENVLFVAGTSFIEIVSPTRPDTTAGRFLERFNGRGGYMAIFDCDNPDERALNANAMGVRTAYVIDRPGIYHARQLDPREARATMLEFDRSIGGDDLTGFYSPAGEGWQEHVDQSVTRDISGIELASRDAAGLAEHWSRLLQRPLVDSASLRIEVDNAYIEVVQEDCARDYLKSVVLDVSDREHVVAEARRRGRLVGEDAVLLNGMLFKLGR